MATFRPTSYPLYPHEKKQQEILSRIERERAAATSAFLQARAVDQKLEPLVREYEEILKIQQIMDEIEGKKS